MQTKRQSGQNPSAPTRTPSRSEDLERATVLRGVVDKLLRRQKTSLTKEQALDARPMHNLEVESSSAEDGDLVLKTDRRKDLLGRLLAFVVAAPLSKRVSLDEMGRFVWNLCDGNRSVREIASLLAAKYKLNRREATISLTNFLRSLGKRGLIGFAIVKDKHDGNPAT